MAKMTYDPYNDFISEGGKTWDRLKGVAEANKCVPNMLQVLNSARKAKLRVFYDFDQINQAVADAQSGAVLKPVLRIA